VCLPSAAGGMTQMPTSRLAMMIHDARAPEKTLLYLPSVVPS